jgi:hypothetical protein
MLFDLDMRYCFHQEENPHGDQSRNLPLVARRVKEEKRRKTIWFVDGKKYEG